MILRVQTWNLDAGAPAELEALLGIAWPQTVGAVASGRAHVICLGPTDWLVIAANTDAAHWLQPVDGALSGSDFRTTDVSDALMRIELSGPEVRNLLAKGCSLDLHASRFEQGRAARTRFAGMPVIIRCLGAVAFECIVTLSYADFLLSWLDDAAFEFGAADMNRP